MEPVNSSMQLTRAADYALRVMVHLATLPRECGRVSLPELAAATGTPESFLSKVLQALTRNLLITSRRGPSGGFAVSESGRAASVRQVVEAVEGPIQLNVCVGQKPGCPRQFWCPSHAVWQQAQQVMFAVLDASTVTDLALFAAPGPRLRVASAAGCNAPGLSVLVCRA